MFSFAFIFYRFLLEEILVRTRAQGTKAGELTDSDGRIRLPLDYNNKEDKSCCFWQRLYFFINIFVSLDSYTQVYGTII